MGDKPNAAAAILKEAEGAHRTSREILSMMQEPAEDPIAIIIMMLGTIQATQKTMLTRLDIIERRLASHK